MEGHFDLYLGEEFEKILRDNFEASVKKSTPDSDEAMSFPGPHMPSEITNRWRTVRIVDTAGIRRQKKVKGDIETQAVYRSLKSISESDIVLLVVDATKGISHQDKRLCDIALEKGKSLIILFNKIDLIKKKIKDPKIWKEWLENIRYSIPWKFCTFIPLSALAANNIKNLKKTISETIQTKISKISTSKLNQCLQDLVEYKQVMVKGEGRPRRLKVKYASIVKMSPPTILIFSNVSRDIPQNYRRYLINGIRGQFSLPNTPIHLIFRTGKEKIKS